VTGVGAITHGALSPGEMKGTDEDMLQRSSISASGNTSMATAIPRSSPRLLAPLSAPPLDTCGGS